MMPPAISAEPIATGMPVAANSPSDSPPVGAASTIAATATTKVRTVRAAPPPSRGRKVSVVPGLTLMRWKFAGAISCAARPSPSVTIQDAEAS